MSSQQLANLAGKAKSGSQDAKSELYRMTCDKCYFLALKLTGNKQDALDIVQESYMRAFANLNYLQQNDKFESWLHSILCNAAKDFFKKRKPILFSDMEPGTELDFEDDRIEIKPESGFDYAETRRLMEEIIGKLPEDQRICVLMYYYQQLSVSEISETLACTQSAVKNRLYHARKKIKEMVLDLEKKGTKLYAAAPLSFWAWDLHKQDETATLSPSDAENIWENLYPTANNLQQTDGELPETVADFEFSGQAENTLSSGPADSGLGTAETGVKSVMSNKVIAAIVAGVVVIGGVTTAVVLGNKPKPTALPEPESSVSSSSAASVSSQAPEETETVYDKVNALLDEDIDGALALLDDDRERINAAELSDEARCALLAHLGKRYESEPDYENAYLCYADAYEIDPQYGEVEEALSGYTAAGWHIGKKATTSDYEQVSGYINNIGYAQIECLIHENDMIGLSNGFSSWRDLSDFTVLTMSLNQRDYQESNLMTGDQITQYMQRMFGPEVSFSKNGKYDGFLYYNAEKDRYDVDHGHGGPSEFYTYYLDSIVDDGDSVYATVYIAVVDSSEGWGADNISYPIYFSKNWDARPFLTVMSNQIPEFYDGYEYDAKKANDYYIGVLKPHQADLRMGVLEMKRNDDGSLYIDSMDVYDGDEFIEMSQDVPAVNSAAASADSQAADGTAPEAERLEVRAYLRSLNLFDYDFTQGYDSLRLAVAIKNATDTDRSSSLSPQEIQATAKKIFGEEIPLVPEATVPGTYAIGLIYGRAPEDIMVERKMNSAFHVKAGDYFTSDLTFAGLTFDQLKLYNYFLADKCMRSGNEYSYYVYCAAHYNQRITWCTENGSEPEDIKRAMEQNPEKCDYYKIVVEKKPDGSYYLANLERVYQSGLNEVQD